MKEGKALIRIQQISVLYMVIWTISPFMSIDNIWRIGALAAFGLWLLCAMSRGLHLERIHMLALAFMALVMIVNIIQNSGFGKIMRPIQYYMMVLLFIVGHFYRDKWKELYFIVPIILLFLIYFNFKSAFMVMDDPRIARLLVRNDKEIYQYLPLTWTNSTITINDSHISYTWKNDTLTLDEDDNPVVFFRNGDSEMRLRLKPGNYSLISAVMNGEDRTEEIIDTTITVDKDGTGVSRNGDYSAAFTWDEYFFTFETDGNQYFYTFDGKILDEYKGSTHLTFSLKE